MISRRPNRTPWSSAHSAVHLSAERADALERRVEASTVQKTSKSDDGSPPAEQPPNSMEDGSPGSGGDHIQLPGG